MMKKKIYYIRQSEATYYCDALDKDGKKIQMFAANGAPIMNGHSYTYQKLKIKFENVHNGKGKGFLCRYVVDINTPKEIADHLEKLAADPNLEIITEKEYLKKVNPDAYRANEKTAALEAENKQLTEKLAEAKSAKAKIKEKDAALKMVQAELAKLKKEVGKK